MPSRQPRTARTERQREREDESLDSLAKDYRFATQRLYSPFTAGCGERFPVAAFNDAHYSQQDTSLNKTLWGLWPVAPPDGFKKVLAAHEAKRDECVPSLRLKTTAALLAFLANSRLAFDLKQDPAKTGWFDRERLPAALPHAEHCRIASMVRLMQELHTRLNAAGWLQFDTLADGLAPMSLLYTRQSMCDVTPLDQAIEAAKRLKKEGDM